MLRFARRFSRQAGDKGPGSMFPPPPGPNPLAHAVRFSDEDSTGGTAAVPTAVIGNDQARGLGSVSQAG
jgi:hypothetical protein